MVNSFIHKRWRNIAALLTNRKFLCSLGIAGAGSVALVTGAILEAKAESQQNKNGIVLKALSKIGRLASVDTKPDIYANFYIAKIEVASPANMHSKEWNELKASHPNQSFKLVTAVAETGSDSFRERTFIMRYAQTKGLSSGAEVTIYAIGQYLYPIYKIYPKAVALDVVSAPDKVQWQRIEKAIKEDKTNPNFVPWRLDWISRSPKHIPK